MKKLSLKKTTLSRLNDNALSNVKGGRNNGQDTEEHRCTRICPGKFTDDCPYTTPDTNADC